MGILLVLAVLFTLAMFALHVSGSRPRLSRPAPPRAARREVAVAEWGERRFLTRVVLASFGLRAVGVVAINLTDAIARFRLSPDSLKYHRLGVAIAEDMGRGVFDWGQWVDNGWFQFTGLVYHLMGPNPVFIQAINITLSSATPVVVYWLALRAVGNRQVARWSALVTAFLPSFVYWSCLMLKDALAIFAVSLLVLSLTSLRQRITARWILAAGIALVMLLGIREYLFFVSVYLVGLSMVPVNRRGFAQKAVRLVVVVLAVGLAAQILGFGFLAVDQIRTSRYFSLDYINSTRVKMGSHGTGAFFDDPSEALWGQDLLSSVWSAAAALFYFVFTLDLRQVASVRQLLALPEVLVFIAVLPFLWRGFVFTFRHYRNSALAMIVFVLGLVAVYGSATTNMGAMFRWRMQAMPLMTILIACGVALRPYSWAARALNRVEAVFHPESGGRRRLGLGGGQAAAIESSEAGGGRS